MATIAPRFPSVVFICQVAIITLMSVEPVKREDLAYYGRTMASVQEFEFATIRLARLILPQLSEGVPFEPVWNKMKGQFKKSDGPLAKPLVDAGHKSFRQ